MNFEVYNKRVRVLAKHHFINSVTKAPDVKSVSVYTPFLTLLQHFHKVIRMVNANKTGVKSYITDLF